MNFLKPYEAEVLIEVSNFQEPAQNKKYFYPFKVYKNRAYSRNSSPAPK